MATTAQPPAPAVQHLWRFPVTTALLSTLAVMTVAIGLGSTRNPVTGDFSIGVPPRSWYAAYGKAPVFVLNALLSSLACSTSGELVLSVPALYFPSLSDERLCGTSRFLALLARLFVMRILLLVAVNSVALGPELWFVMPASPAWLIVALTVVWRRSTTPPRTIVFAGLGPKFPAPAHIVCDVFAVQCALITPAQFTIPVGIATGLIASSRFFGLASLRPMRRVGPFYDKPTAAVSMVVPAPPSAPSTARPAAAAAADTVVPPAPADVTAPPTAAADAAALVELGFSPEQAATALQRAGGDVDRAAGMLLSGEIPHQ